VPRACPPRTRGPRRGRRWCSRGTPSRETRRGKWRTDTSRAVKAARPFIIPFARHPRRRRARFDRNPAGRTGEKETPGENANANRGRSREPSIEGSLPRSRARSPPSPSRLRRASTAAPAHTLARVTPASQSANGPPRHLAPRPAPTAPRPPPSSPPTRASSRPRDVPRQSLRARDRPVASRTPRPHRPLAPPAAMPAETKPAEPQDMYAVLGVSSTATSTEIRRAYRNLITKARARRIDPRVVSRSPRARPLSFLPGASLLRPFPAPNPDPPPIPPSLRATATPG